MSSPRPEESPRFSILIPSYNRAGYLLEALEGVRTQSFTDYELIIIDDASRDDSVAVIERWLASTGVRARFIRHATNVGLVGVINEFAALARGALLTWCACDDVWLPGRLERHAAAFAHASDDVAIVCGNCELIDAEGRSLGLVFDGMFRFPEDPHAALLSLERIFIATPSCTLRKTCVDAVGRWNTRYLQEDFDMFLRLTERYAVVFQNEVGVKYRQLADSFGKSRSNADRFAADTLRILLDRRPRNEGERMAIENGKARLLELAYAYTRETGSPASNARLRALIDAAGAGNTRHRLVALSVRANIPFAAYWTAAKLIRRIGRISRAWRPSARLSTV